MLNNSATHFIVHFLISADRNFIEEFNSYINKFNIKVMTLHATHFENAKRLIIENELNYIYIQENSALKEHIEDLVDLLKQYNKTDCKIIVQDKNPNITSIEYKNLIFVEEFNYDLYKTLVTDLLRTNKNANNPGDFENIYQDHFMATHDSLTMLPNRACLLERIVECIDNDLHNSRIMAVFFLDLDNFKDINDKSGHHTGDAVLKTVADRLVNNTRISDIVSRHGGDEFIVFLSNIRSQKDSETIANKLLDILAEPIYVDEEVWNVTASIGVALYPTDGITAEKLIYNADAAMYLAKQSGKNKIKFFNKHLDEELEKKYNIINEVRESIVNNDFDVVLQPQHNLSTDELIGVELFIRWIHPTKGVILPNDFLPYIYNTGYINSLGDLIVRKALGLYYELKRVCSKNISIAIKVTPRQFINDAFIERIAGIKAMGVSVEHLMIEITEDCFKNNFEVAQQKLYKLKDIGVRICLDNFGLGNSSLSQLFQLPIDVIKIDNKLFYTAKNNEHIKRGLIALAHSLGIKVMAKRIDNREQLDQLLVLNCDYGQGYCYEKPLQLPEFVEYARRMQENFKSSKS